MNKHFVRNIEDEKLEIHFSKQEYLSLPEDQKTFIKRYCLFSGSRKCWRSRCKLDSANFIISELLKYGFEDKGSEGEKLTFAEKVEREMNQAAAKLDRIDELHKKAEQESDQRSKAAHNILSFIPPGQPILVGHHSEKRHRKDLERVDTNFRKSIEADEKAKYYVEKRLRLALSVGEFGKRPINQLAKAAMKNRSTILYSSAPIAANRLLVFVFFCAAELL